MQRYTKQKFAEALCCLNCSINKFRSVYGVFDEIYSIIVKRHTMNKIICFLIVLIGLSSCSNHGSNKSMSEVLDSQQSSITEEVPISEVAGSMDSRSVTNSGSITNFLTSQAASIFNNDGLHKLIRSAQIKFKVENVPQATFKIEEITLKNGGIIMESSINNNRSYAVTTNISEDSAQITYSSTLLANMQLKVPKLKLDTVLKQIAPLAVDIDYRKVEARDVTIQIMVDSLTQARAKKKNSRIQVAIDTKPSKLNDVVEAEESLDNSLLQADQAFLSAYSLNEQIDFSVITINIYQSPIQCAEKIVREKVIEEYKSGLLSQASDAFLNGCYFISALFVLLLNIWPILLVFAIVIVIFLRRKKSKK